MSTGPRQEGLALVGALWAVALLVMLVSGVLASARVQVELTAHDERRSRLRLAAEGGVSLGIEAIALPRRSVTPGLPEVSPSTRLNGMQVAVEIRNEAGKVDLNRADAALVGGALGWAGVPAADRLRVVSRLRERRRRAAVADAPAPFTSVHEFAVEMGLDGGVADRLTAIVTVHGTSGLNPRVASPEALAAVPGLGAAEIELYLERRERDPFAVPSVPGVDRYLDDGLSAHYTVAARAGDVDVSLELGCLVRMQSVPADPYQVLFCADRTRSRNHGG